MGEVTILKQSDGRIPWPVGKSGRALSLVLYGDLAEAVRREPACAIQFWWGVGASAVNKWRKALGVPRINDGASRLMTAIGKSPARKPAIEAMRAKARDPVRRAKIAAAKRGKPRPAHVHEALRRANTGRPLTAEHRRKQSEAHKRRGTRPPKAGRAWEAWEDELLRTLPVAEVVKRTGRGLGAVYSRRYILGLPDGRSRKQRRRFGHSA